MKPTILQTAACAAALLASAAFADAHRFTATVDYAGAPAEDVPAALRISADLVEGFDYAAAGDGTHFEITDENGATLPYEIDTWNPGGESLLWVKVPIFANGKRLTVVYGRTDRDMAAHAAEVWSNYIGVWHMNATNALGKYPNSSGDARFDGEVSSFSRTGQAGKFGQSALIFTNAYHGKKNTAAANEKGGVFIPDGGNLDLSGDFAISGWFNHTTAEAKSYDSSNDSKAFRWDNIFCKRPHPETTTSGGFGLRIGDNQNDLKKLQLCTEANRLECNGASNFGTGKWHHFALVFGGSAVTNRIDGERGNVQNLSSALADNDGPLVVGNPQNAYLDNGGDRAWGGYADEVRLVRGAPSESWLAAEYAAMTGALSCGPETCTLVIDRNENFDDAVTVSSDIPPVAEGKYRRGTTVTLTAVPNATGTFRKWYGDVPRERCTNATVSVTLEGDAWIYARFVHPWTLAADYATMTDGHCTVNVSIRNYDARTLTVGKAAAAGLVAANDTGTGTVDLGGPIRLANDQRLWTIAGFARHKGSQCPPTSRNGDYRGYISPGTATETNYYQIFHRGDNSEGAQYTDFIIIDEPDLNYFLHDNYMFSSQSQIKHFVLDLPLERKFGGDRSLFFYSMRAYDTLANTKFDWWNLPRVDNICNQTLGGRWGRGDELALRAPCTGTLSLPSIRGVDWVEGAGTQFFLMANVTEISLGGFDEATTVTNLGIYAFAGNTHLQKLTLHAAPDMTVASRIFADKTWNEWKGYVETNKLDAAGNPVYEDGKLVKLADLRNVQTEVIDGITFRVGTNRSLGRVPDVIHFTGPAISETAISNLLADVPVVSTAAKPVAIHASRYQDGWRDNRRGWISDSTPAEWAAYPGQRVIGVYRAGAEAPAGKAVIIHADNDWDQREQPTVMMLR